MCPAQDRVCSILPFVLGVRAPSLTQGISAFYFNKCEFKERVRCIALVFQRPAVLEQTTWSATMVGLQHLHGDLGVLESLMWIQAACFSVALCGLSMTSHQFCEVSTPIERKAQSNPPSSQAQSKKAIATRAQPITRCNSRTKSSTHQVPQGFCHIWDRHFSHI